VRDSGVGVSLRKPAMGYCWEKMLQKRTDALT
jgi:hypothetical protein